jgi:hypothetical protein
VTVPRGRRQDHVEALEDRPDPSFRVLQQEEGIEAPPLAVFLQKVENVGREPPASIRRVRFEVEGDLQVVGPA